MVGIVYCLQTMEPPNLVSEIWFDLENMGFTNLIAIIIHVYLGSVEPATLLVWDGKKWRLCLRVWKPIKQLVAGWLRKCAAWFNTTSLLSTVLAY